MAIVAVRYGGSLVFVSGREVEFGMESYYRLFYGFTSGLTFGRVERRHIVEISILW
jgi:hypothetical protein